MVHRGPPTFQKPTRFQTRDSAGFNLHRPTMRGSNSTAMTFLHVSSSRIVRLPVPRGLHSSTFRLNLSAFCGIGGTFRGCLGGVQGVIGGV